MLESVERSWHSGVPILRLTFPVKASLSECRGGVRRFASVQVSTSPLEQNEFSDTASVGVHYMAAVLVAIMISDFSNRERLPEPQWAESTAHGLSTAVLILAWGRYGLTPKILFIKSKSTKIKSQGRRLCPSTHNTPRASSPLCCAARVSLSSGNDNNTLNLIIPIP